VLQVRVQTDGEMSGPFVAELRRLVDDAFAGDFSDEDWQHTAGGWRVVAFDGQAPVAHAAIVPRLLRVAERPVQTGYVEGVATLPANQRQGVGSLVITQVTSLLRARFEMGALSTGRTGFYARFGWESWRGPSFVLDGTELIRTPDEDDGLMVLRFGPSADIDLAAPISCERRSGDDW
jgi:aminoglycoside 2'-N-acetyltransferase I